MTLRIGLIGCGFIGALHSRALKGIVDAGLADAAVVAVCDLDCARAESFARAHGADVATGDPSEVLAASDAVWICTPTSSHRELVEAAASGGLAIFCEKPLAPTLVDAEAMAAAVAEAAVANQVGLVLRTAPVFLALRDLLAQGALGRPMAVVFRDDQYFPVQGIYGSDWRADVAMAGGGTLLEHSIHDLDLLRWLLGEVEEVAAHTANFAGYRGIEDAAVAMLRFGSGATATLTSVWHQLLSRASTRRLEVICERGFAWTDDDWLGPLHVDVGKGASPVVTEPPAWARELPVAGPWREFVAVYTPADLAFLRAVAEGRPAGPDLDQAVLAHRLADAVYRSASDGGRPVRVVAP